MYGSILVFHVIISALLVIVVMMQSGKGGGLSGAFGGGGNQTVFGGRGAVDFLGRATWFLGAGFMFTSLVLALLSAGQTAQDSLIEKSNVAPPTSAPAGESPVGGFGSPVDPAVDGEVTPSEGAVPSGSEDTGGPGETGSEPEPDPVPGN